MSQTAINIQQQQYDAGTAKGDMKLEVALIPVSDVDRAKEFYTRLGWRLDDDIVMGNDFRVVQLTPPGSRCSISFGKGVTSAAPRSLRGGLIVSDIEAAHNELVARGINASEVSPRVRHRVLPPTFPWSLGAAAGFARARRGTRRKGWLKIATAL